MNGTEVTITNKERLLDWLKGLPDDAVIIRPVWGVHGQIKCATKKYPNPSIDVRLTLAEDIIKDSGVTISNLYKLQFIPIFFVAGEKAKEALTDKAFELAHNK